MNKKEKQAGAELGQAQDKLKFIVGVQVKVAAEVEVSVNHYKPGWALEFTKLILISFQIEDVVELRVEL